MSDFSASQSSAEAVEFKGRMLTLSVLKLNSADLAEVESALAEKVQRSADFFRNMPVLLDVAADALPLGAVADLVRKYGMVPVAVYEASSEVAAAASHAGLGVINDPRAAKKAEEIAAKPAESPAPRQKTEPQPETTAEPAPVAPAGNVTKVVSTPVRSGQQIYARGGDLVVLGAVSPGAEVLADGHIHIYGALRGRALAGVQGDKQARIFCSQMGAELVSVAGCYKISEDIPGKVLGRAAQIYLDGERLEIAALQ